MSMNRWCEQYEWQECQKLSRPHDFSVVVESWEDMMIPSVDKKSGYFKRATRVACRWCGAQREVAV